MHNLLSDFSSVHFEEGCSLKNKKKSEIIVSDFSYIYN